MESCKESTVTGFNEFIRSQKKIPGEATVKLVQFDDQYETVFDKRLEDCPELNQSTFMPRGSTALLDAQGRTIVELGQELAALPKQERPSKVIVVTLTDGLENASQHYNLEKIGELIREQRDKYHWDFVFLGANQDAIETAAAMNIPLPSAMSYSTSKAGMMGLARVAAVAYAQRNIRVNSIVPGTMDTPMNHSVLCDQESRDEYSRAVPLGRLGKPDDVEGLAVFLASDESAYCTGGLYMCDGGLTAV